MSVDRRFNDFACLTAALAMVAFVVADGRLWMALPLLGVAMLGWVAGAGPRARRPWTLPKIAVTLMVLAAILFAASAAMNAVRLDPVVSILGLFLTHITAIKLFDRRSPRDDAQLLTLSLFDVIAAVLTGNELLVGVLVALLAPCAIAAAMLWQFRHGAAAAPSSPATWGARGRGQFSSLVIAATVAACGAATFIFLFAPRGWAQDVLGRFGQARETTIGFNDSPRLGQAGFLSEDQTPVMNVAVSDVEGTNLGSGESTLYLRGSVKDRYDPETWTWTQAAGEHRAIVDSRWSNLLHADRVAPAGILRTLRVSMRGSPKSDGPLFTMWRPIALKLDSRETLRVLEDSAVFKRSSQSAMSSRRGAGSYEYTVTFLPSEDGGPLPPAPLPTFKNSRIEALARQITDAAGVVLDGSDSSLRQAAVAIREHLRTKYAYTVEMIAPEVNEDPIEMFLFRTKRGHCEYFAAAMVAMCQSLDIPARMVLGYVATEFNPMTGQYLVRESNAHAWVETHIGRGRWLSTDPSPPGDIERVHRPADSPLAMLRRWWDALEFTWAKAVVSFDRNSQSRLLGVSPDIAARNLRANTAADRTANFLHTVRAEGFNGVLKIAAPVAFVIAVVLVIARVFPSLAGRVRVLLASRSADPEQRRALAHAPFYAEALRHLRRAALAPPVSSTPLAHSETLRSTDAQLGIAFGRVTELFYRVRFGNQTLTAQDQQEGHRLAGIVAARAQQLRRDNRARTVR